ncbi:MAG: 50S ribosomal protein L22 [Candidatus Buchananbacteria bacterium RIFCSPLOWO2_01_FULL_46_12]|uniref:Large ribosomal subunit protein uL22 n=2 Tax=Candidatus Buchananiibacteriota TaxID=1817903 RepID=A0A1G1YRB5_9BACT|nr:MAG: 50S ribosomal protein L22 [Candidatus Buchananbacteria bacterium RIFCSPHIGHO2_01_FULL_44_11]OGY54844.1 MAG: 50S ribosomal protein L22 [Candidatus Buchananbacteria bacterium RIFCSPLOWO2_01_FULL_46_12]
MANTEKKDKKSNKPTEVKTGQPDLSLNSSPVAKIGKNNVTEVKASARYVRMSTRKTRLVANLLRKKNAQVAVDELKLIKRAAVRPVIKLINSALANAENNFNLVKSDLYIKEITVGEGPTFDRWQPKAHGRATPIRRRTSHIDLVLGLKPGAKTVARKVSQAENRKSSAEGSQATKQIKETVAIVNPQDVKRPTAKIPGQTAESTVGQGQKGFINKIFNRKTG